MYLNACDLKPKFSELASLSLMHRPDIIICTETFFTMQQATVYNLDGYSHHFSCRSDRKGGGISVWITSNFASCVEIRYLDVDQCFEIIVCSFIIGKLTQYVIACYKPPNMGSEKELNFLNIFTDVLDKFWQLHPVIIGDFNYPDINWNVSPPMANSYAGSAFLEVHDHYSFLQHINFNTRFRDGVAPSLLDLLITDCEAHVEDISSFPPIHKSDHVTICWKVLAISVIRGENNSPLYKATIDFSTLNADLEDCDWATLMNRNDVWGDWTSFRTYFDSLVDKATVVKPLHFYKDSWMTRDIRNSLNRKTKLWRRFAKSRSPGDYAEFVRARDTVKSSILAAKQDFEYRLIRGDRDNKNMKNLFSYIKHTKGGSSCPKVLRLDGQSVTSPNEIATMFAAKFNEISGIAFDCHLCPPMLEYRFPCFNDLQREELWFKIEICSAIVNLKNSASTGFDGFSSICIKQCMNHLIHPLTIIFMGSLAEGYIPPDLKRAKIIPVLKKGSALEVNNYRPISLIPTFSKVFEYVINRWLLSEVSYIFHDPYQHGFTRGLSTESNLLTFTHYVSSVLDLGGQVDTIYIDISKAFDSVPHNLLVTKLFSLGVNPILVRWVANYLSGRTQSIFIDGSSMSCTGRLRRGVPQGSILGPLLFNIFISEITTCVRYSKVLLYADDLKMFRQVSVLADAELLQTDLISITDWLNSNFMSLSVDKTVKVSYGKRNVLYAYNCQGVNIRANDSVLDLGVYFDRQLTFTLHVDFVIKKLLSLYFLVRAYFGIWSTTLTTLIINTYVRPIIEYCSCVWNIAPSMFKGCSDKLDRVINSFTKLCRHIAALPSNQRLVADVLN